MNADNIRDAVFAITQSNVAAAQAGADAARQEAAREIERLRRTLAHIRSLAEEG